MGNVGPAFALALLQLFELLLKLLLVEFLDALEIPKALYGPVSLLDFLFLSLKFGGKTEFYDEFKEIVGKININQ